MLEENPLKIRKRTKRPEDMTPQMKEIEEEFLPFNTNPHNGKRALPEESKQKLRENTLAVEEQLAETMSSSTLIGEDSATITKSATVNVF